MYGASACVATNRVALDDLCRCEDFVVSRCAGAVWKALRMLVDSSQKQDERMHGSETEHHGESGGRRAEK
jgi:hypothetical protein